MAGKLNEAGKPEAMELQQTQKFQRFLPSAGAPRLKNCSNNCRGTNEK